MARSASVHRCAGAGRDVVVMPVDFAAGDRPHPCRTCDHWWHEDAVGVAGEQVLREWHAASCPTLLYWA